MSWTVLGESVAGTSHRARQIPCQDAFRFRTFGHNDEWLAVAVADGAGSASHSDRGAILACDEFVRRVEDVQRNNDLTADRLIALFTDVRSALLAESERLSVWPRELACTALLAIVGPESAVFGQVGDGAIVFGGGQRQTVVFWPEPAMYVNATAPHGRFVRRHDSMHRHRRLNC